MNSQEKKLSLSEKVLLASLELSGGSTGLSFTAEELLIASWKANRRAFGLRGFENDYPDSNKLYTKIDGKDGLVAKGLLRGAGERTYQITEVGNARAYQLKRDLSPDEADYDLDTKLDRTLQVGIAEMVSSKEFRAWLGDASKPTRFREAGNFWGIASGTPSKTVRNRILRVDQIVNEALKRLDELGVERIVEQRGKEHFDRLELERLLEFNGVLKKRFSRELKILDPEGMY